MVQDGCRAARLADGPVLDLGEQPLAVAPHQPAVKAADAHDLPWRVTNASIAYVRRTRVRCIAVDLDERFGKQVHGLTLGRIGLDAVFEVFEDGGTADRVAPSADVLAVLRKQSR